jgi:hypothetical protein
LVESTKAIAGIVVIDGRDGLLLVNARSAAISAALAIPMTSTDQERDRTRSIAPPVESTPPTDPASLLLTLRRCQPSERDRYAVCAFIDRERTTRMKGGLAMAESGKSSKTSKSTPSTRDYVNRNGVTVQRDPDDPETQRALVAGELTEVPERLDS